MPETYARAALAILADLADAGFFADDATFATLKKDADLAFRRQRPDFQRWLAALDAARKKP